jgi:hypothetical protein
MLAHTQAASGKALQRSPGAAGPIVGRSAIQPRPAPSNSHTHEDPRRSPLTKET